MIDGAQESFAYDYVNQLTSDNGRSALYDPLHQRLETEGKLLIMHAISSLSTPTVIRRSTLNLLKEDKVTKVGMKNRRLKAGWNREYLLGLIGVK